MKKLLSVFLSVLLVFVMSIPVFAGDEKTLDIVATDCNIHLIESDTDTIKYYFDKNLFSVTKKTSGDITTIKAAIKPGAVTDFDDKIEIAIPSDMFSAISADIKRAGLALPTLNIDYDIVSDNGAVSFSPPTDYSQNFKANLNHSSGSLLFDKAATDFAVTIKSEQSAVSVPKTWSKFSPKTEYAFTSGDGSAEFDITLNGSSFAVKQ
jgi:hypothetical protein